MFVVVEGIEGSGKSTLVAGLVARLRESGKDVVVTREPGGTFLGNAVRKVFLDRDLAVTPLAEAFLVNAARAQHVEDVIRPALDSGKTVLCDRFTDSTIAYQGYGRGLPLEDVRAMCLLATGALRPSLVLLLDLPVAVACTRLRERPQTPDRIEREGEAFHERVRQGFLALARAPDHRVLDATLSAQDLLQRALREMRVPLRDGAS